jgi:hypothetical protein
MIEVPVVVKEKHLAIASEYQIALGSDYLKAWSTRQAFCSLQIMMRHGKMFFFYKSKT